MTITVSSDLRAMPSEDGEGWNIVDATPAIGADGTADRRMRIVATDMSRDDARALVAAWDAQRKGVAADRYFLTKGSEPEREVSRTEWISAESSAGFVSKSGPGTQATAGFDRRRPTGDGWTGVAGRIETSNKG